MCTLRYQQSITHTQTHILEHIQFTREEKIGEHHTTLPTIKTKLLLDKTPEQLTTNSAKPWTIKKKSFRYVDTFKNLLNCTI